MIIEVIMTHVKPAARNSEGEAASCSEWLQVYWELLEFSWPQETRVVWQKLRTVYNSVTQCLFLLLWMCFCFLLYFFMFVFIWSSHPHLDTWLSSPHALSRARQPWNRTVYPPHQPAGVETVWRADSPSFPIFIDAELPRFIRRWLMQMRNLFM